MHEHVCCVLRQCVFCHVPIISLRWLACDFPSVHVLYIPMFPCYRLPGSSVVCVCACVWVCVCVCVGVGVGVGVCVCVCVKSHTTLPSSHTLVGQTVQL